MINASEFLRLALDPLRLAILGRAAEGQVDIDEIAAAMHVRKRDVLVAVGKLRSAGLLDGDATIDRDLLRAMAADLPSVPDPDPEITDGTWSEDERQILGRFFSRSRLTSIPSHLAKRRVVLERLAQEFEPGLRYVEADVNFTLQLFHADYATLRRYLVDEGFLTRAEGFYWRSGGRYEALGNGDE